MKIFRIILLGIAMALFAVNFWTIDYDDLWNGQNMWPYFRIVVAFILVILLLVMIKKDRNRRRSDI